MNQPISTQRNSTQDRIDDQDLIDEIFEAAAIRSQTLEQRKLGALRTRLGHLRRLEQERRRVESYNADGAAFDDLFPLEALPKDTRILIEGLKETIGSPFGASFATLMTVSSGFLGKDKARIYTPCRPFLMFPPMIHTLLVGKSGSGKTSLTSFFLAPFHEYDEQLQDFYNKEKRRKTRIFKELESLYTSNQQTDDDKRTIKRNELLLEFLQTGGAACYTDWKSVEAIHNYAIANKMYAAIVGRAQEGFVLWRGNAASFFYHGYNHADIGKTLDFWSELDNIADGKAKPSNAVSRIDAGTPPRVGAGYLFEAQNDCFYCVNVKNLQGNGFINRFLLAYTPKDRKYRYSQETNLDPWGLSEQWREIFRFIREFQGAPFLLDCAEDLTRNSERLGGLADNAEKEGDALKASFIDKLYGITCQIALNLHIQKLATQGRQLEFLGGLPNELTRVDFATAPEWSRISSETFQNAVKLAEYYRKTWNMIIPIISEASKPTISTVGTTDDGTIDRLPPGSQRVYDVINEYGEPFDLLQEGDGLGRALDIKDINAKLSRYQDKAKRASDDDGLIQSGLMFYENRASRGRRIVIPKDLSIDDLRKFLKEDYLSDDEAEAA